MTIPRETLIVVLTMLGFGAIAAAAGVRLGSIIALSTIDCSSNVFLCAELEAELLRFERPLFYGGITKMLAAGAFKYVIPEKVHDADTA